MQTITPVKAVKPVPTTLTLVCAAALALTGPGAQAQTPEYAATASQSQSAQVFIDPDTGERRPPTAAELEAMARQTPSETRELEIIRRDDGMRMVRMPQSSRMQLKATVNKNGQVETGHQPGAGDE